MFEGIDKVFKFGEMPVKRKYAVVTIGIVIFFGIDNYFERKNTKEMYVNQINDLKEQVKYERGEKEKSKSEQLLHLEKDIEDNRHQIAKDGESINLIKEL